MVKTSNDRALGSLSRCPLCEADSDEFRVVTKNGFRFSGEKAVICLVCGLVFLNPRTNRHALSEYYLGDSFSQEFRGGEVPDSAAIDYRHMRARRRWGFLKDVLPRTGRCLEIGCSSGNFLSILQAEGYQVFGIDPSTSYAQYAQRLGLEVVIGMFPEDLPKDYGRFDILAAFHVLEHVDDPLEVLRAMKEYSTDNGLLVLEYPDISMAVKRAKLLPTYFQKAHLYDFSLDTITDLLAIAGFQVYARFSDSEPPYDKNVLLVARAASPKEVSNWNTNRANSLHKSLKRKLAMHQNNGLRQVLRAVVIRTRQIMKHFIG